MGIYVGNGRFGERMSDLNRVLYADDCLNILRDGIEPQSVDLIYLDPPFNSNSQYNLPFKGYYQSVKPVSAFKDTWDWGDDEESRYKELRKGLLTKHIADLISVTRRIENRAVKNSMAAYLLNMYDRLVEMHRVMKPTGSIYLHCDPAASHYLKLLMDSIFGRKCFRNEVTWQRTESHNTANKYGNIADIISLLHENEESDVESPI